MTTQERIDRLIARKEAILAEKERRRKEKEQLETRAWQLAQQLEYALKPLVDIPVFVEDNHNIVRCYYSKQSSDHHQVWLTAAPSNYIALFNIRTDYVRGEPIITVNDHLVSFEEAVELAVQRVESIFDTTLEKK